MREILSQSVDTKRKTLCSVHDNWAGKPNKTSICDECLAGSEDRLDHMYYEGIPLRVIIRRPAP
jgi:hypothetical protein